MSVSEYEETPPETREAFERTPPQDVTAEQSVLGGMMLSKDAIADVVENLKPGDFYRPAHEMIYSAVLDLYARGEPADAVTVAAELTRRGEIGRVGGAPYLHTLISAVPTAANAEYYARIVHERSVLRRLVQAGTRIVQMGYAADGEVDDIVDSAQAEVYAVTEQRTAEDYAPLADIMEGALDEIEALGSRQGQMSGVPTGFADLDELTNGLHPGQMVVVAARPAMGKALAVDTPLPTPRGWTTMGRVRPGDLLLGSDGRPVRVLAATGVMYERPCHRVEFTDGTAIVADAAHLWSVLRPGESVRESLVSGQRPVREVLTTRRMAERLRREDGPAFRVPLAAPLALPEAAALPMPPYPLGVWLACGAPAPAPASGAGELPVTLDPEVREEILDQVRLAGTGVRPDPARPGGLLLARPPRDAGTRPDARAPRVPAAYLRAGVAQRRDLLAGLLDAAGQPADGGRTVHLEVNGPALARDVCELALGLGQPARVEQASAPPEQGEPEQGEPGPDVGAVRVTLTPVDKVFRVAGKLARQSLPSDGPGPVHTVTAVQAVPSVPVRCVQVDAADRLYLAGPALVPTHNSTLALDFARSASIKHNLPSVIFSLEMGRNEIAMRLLSAEARVALHHMRTGNMSDDDWTRLARRMSDVSSAPMYIDDSPNLSMMEIRAKCRRLRQRNDLRLVVIDYLQLMTGGGGRRAESRQQEVSEMSRNLKLLAKELEVPVIALSQLNRGPEQRTDKKPMISDLRESGSIEQDADVVILLHREDAYEKESPRAGEADLIVAKHRNGPTRTITVAFQGHYSRFVDMQG